MQTEFTLGVEEEFQIVDPGTRALCAGIDTLIEGWGEGEGNSPKAELHKCALEVATGICGDITELRRQVVANRRHAARVAEAAGMRIVAAGTHPSARWEEQDLSIGPLYERIVNDLQDVARANLIFGMHVHVGVADRREAIAIYNSARYFLPHLLALSTSSPFFESRASGLKSMRSLLFERLPRTGIPGRFESLDEFERLVDLLVTTGCIDSGQQIWWDLRPHPRYGTLEFRVCDEPTRVDDVVALAALVQALVATLARIHRSNMTWNLHRSALMRENKWRALRYGIEGHLIDLGRRQEVAVPALVDEIIAFVADEAQALGSLAEVEHCREIVRRGTSAEAQMEVYHAHGGDLDAVVDWLIEETCRGL